MVLASSLFRPRRFVSLRAAGFLFFLPDFCYNRATMNPACWLLQGHIAHLNLPGVSLVFDADRPAEGLAKVAVVDRPLSGVRLLGVRASIQSAAVGALADWHA